MAIELLRYAGEMKWLRTIIRQRAYGVETEIHLSTAKGVLSAAVDSFPSRAFLIAALNPFSITIEDRSSRERGWTEATRFRIRLNDDDELDSAEINGSYARYRFTEHLEESDDV